MRVGGIERACALYCRGNALRHKANRLRARGRGLLANLLDLAADFYMARGDRVSGI